MTLLAFVLIAPAAVAAFLSALWCADQPGARSVLRVLSDVPCWVFVLLVAAAGWVAEWLGFDVDGEGAR